jgi:hypothetical protein
MVITVLEALRQYLFGPRSEMPMALLHFLKKLDQLSISSLLSVLEILRTSLTAL